MSTAIDILLDYGLFLVKAITIVIAIFVVFSSILAAAAKYRHDRPSGYLEIKNINKRLERYADAVHEAVLSPAEIKKYWKNQKKKPAKQQARKRLFFIQFKGDLQASATAGLRKEVSAVLTSVREQDGIAVSIESAGGMVSHYGFAASQLQRIRDQGIHLTVVIDKVAASGGYLMACVANKIIAAPFALVGSIGVLAQLPNFHRLLKKSEVDMNVVTAGEFKRTITMFGDDTAVGKAKFQEEIDDIHRQFKDIVRRHRPEVDIAKAATGEAWLAEQAQGIGLVDELMTSDAYLTKECEERDVFQVRWIPRMSRAERFLDRAAAYVGRWLGVFTRPF